MESNNIISPFVMKTYEIVNDPASDSLITWGKANNSFIVLDPLDFSQRILPIYFKHNNFSSFVRQLNTYGFKKVDPDRWEFANEWFLRGQSYLLKNIARRKRSRNLYSSQYKQEGEDGDHEEELLMEIARLKQEQKEMDKELLGMSKRLEATEKRPNQMMAFLRKVAKDPEILPRLMLEKENNKRLKTQKNPCLTISSLSSLSSSPPSSSGAAVTSSTSEGEEGTTRVISTISLPPDTSEAWLNQPYSYALIPSQLSAETTMVGGFMTAETPLNSSISGDEKRSTGDMGYLVGVGVETCPLPYPFSLLGDGFY